MVKEGMSVLSSMRVSVVGMRSIELTALTLRVLKENFKHQTSWKNFVCADALVGDS